MWFKVDTCRYMYLLIDDKNIELIYYITFVACYMFDVGEMQSGVTFDITTLVVFVIIKVLLLDYIMEIYKHM